jgi:hypothetical protein
MSCKQSLTFFPVETNSLAAHFAGKRLEMSAARIDKEVDDYRQKYQEFLTGTATFQGAFFRTLALKM